jgi:hypothetical protein
MFRPPVSPPPKVFNVFHKEAKMVRPILAAAAALAGMAIAPVAAQQILDGSPGGCSSAYPADAAVCASCSNGGGGSGCYDSCEPACDSPAVCGCGSSAVWSVSGGALFLIRDDENAHPFSYDDPNEDRQYLFNRDADFGAAPGFEARVTRFDCCTQSACEFVYWQLFPSDEEATVYGSDLTGNLSAILNYDQLDYNGTTADNFTNNAYAHRLRRDMDVYNAELNQAFVRGGSCECRHSIASLYGLRFFKFDEDLQFASDPNDGEFTGEIDELYHDVEVENNLFGFQLGGFGEYKISHSLGLVCGAKAGVFANFAEGYSRIGGAAGTAVINNGPNAGRSWIVDTDKEDLAMLAEVILGLQYQVGCNWRIGADYRVIGVSGVALPTNQIYSDTRGINDVERLATNGSLILHGAFLRLERFF